MLEFLKKLTADSKNKQLDFTFLLTLIILLAIGLVALSSASSYYALTEYGDSSYYLVRQLIFAIAGIVVMIIVSKVDYKQYKKYGYLIYIICIALMFMVFIPGIGSSAKGAQRWLNLGLFTFQPSEIMKLGLIIGMSTYIVKNQKKMKTWKGYIVPISMAVLVCILMYFQSHLSGAIVMLAICAIIIIASGFKVKTRTIIIVGLTAIALVAAFLFSEEYRLERVKAFLDPESDIQGGNWQPTQSLYAIGSGGIFGRGIGQSRQKYLWLPEAQNDFVFAVYAEEFGFAGAIIVVGLFAFLIIRGISIGLKSKDLYGMLITVGIIGMFAFQIVINIAVVTKLIPTTGMPLPFFSSGGTSLVINLAAMGIVLNISRQGSK